MQTWRIYQIIHTVPQQNTILIHLVHSCPILKRLTLNRTCNSNAPNCTILHIIRVPYVLIILYTYITSWSIVSIVLKCYIIYDYKVIIYIIYLCCTILKAWTKYDHAEACNCHLCPSCNQLHLCKCSTNKRQTCPGHRNLPSPPTLWPYGTSQLRNGLPTKKTSIWTWIGRRLWQKTRVLKGPQISSCSNLDRFRV